MLREKNEYIAVKGFCYLVLDYEFPENQAFNEKSYCSGRVLCEDLFRYYWKTETREEAIEKFMNGSLQEV